MSGPFLDVFRKGRLLDRLDLSDTDRYLLKSNNEFYRFVELQLKTATGIPLRVNQIDQDSPVIQVNNSEVKLLISRPSISGTVGYQTISLEIQVEDTLYPLDLILSIDPASLEQAQYHAMLRDISHWIFFSLSSPIERELRNDSHYDPTLRPVLLLLKLFEERIPTLERVLLIIQSKPHGHE